MNFRKTMTALEWQRRFFANTVPVQAVRAFVLLPVAVSRPQDWAFRWEQR